MGIFGRRRELGPPHPRKEPVFDAPLSLEAIQSAFQNCVDFTSRKLELAGDREKEVWICGVEGMVRTERHGKIIFYSVVNEVVNDVLLKGVEFLGY